jgi:hypothetical protein
MWCDYKQANPSPTQQDIAQWVWNTFGAQGAIDSNGDGIIDYLDRAVWPIEYGDVLNHFISATKYHRWFLPMELPGQPNNPADSMWHWLLVVGCAADGWPGTGGVNVFGLRDGKVTAMVIVDAARGQFHRATACTAGWSNFPSLPSEAVENLVLLQRQVNVRRMELVWGFCKEALSPYMPLWKVESETGGVFYVSQRGTIHQMLTRHSCIGGGK